MVNEVIALMITGTVGFFLFIFVYVCMHLCNQPDDGNSLNMDRSFIIFGESYTYSDKDSERKGM